MNLNSSSEVTISDRRAPKYRALYLLKIKINKCLGLRHDSFIEQSPKFRHRSLKKEPGKFNFIKHYTFTSNVIFDFEKVFLQTSIIN